MLLEKFEAMVRMYTWGSSPANRFQHMHFIDY